MIATPLMFRVIVTDDFPSLIGGVDFPSPTSPLRFTKRLYIEYSDKSTPPSYLGLMGDFPWAGCGTLNPVEEHGLRMANSMAEVRRLTAALQRVHPVGLDEVMPRLRTVAVASIWGKESADWQLYKQHRRHGDEKEIRTESCAELFQDVLACSCVTAQCIRDISGPLSISKIATVTPYHTMPSATYHFGSPYGLPHSGPGPHGPDGMYFTSEIEELPLVLGGRVRWTSELGAKEDFASLANCVQ